MKHNPGLSSVVSCDYFLFPFVVNYVPQTLPPVYPLPCINFHRKKMYRSDRSKTSVLSILLSANSTAQVMTYSGYEDGIHRCPRCWEGQTSFSPSRKNGLNTWSAAGSFSRRTILRERIRKSSEASCYFLFGHWASALHVVTKLTDKTFEELVAVRTEHCSPQPSEVMQQFRLNSRSKKAENLWQRTSYSYVIMLNFVISVLLWTRCSRTDSYGPVFKRSCFRKKISLSDEP